jgi:hypothetical protein
LKLHNLVLAIGAAAALAACGDDDGGGGTGVANRAGVRAVHAVPDAQAVDVLVDGVELRRGANLTYRGVTDLTAVDAGERTVRVELASNGAAVFEQQAALTTGVDYTLVATGSATAASVTPIIATYGRVAPPSGQVQIRVIHASPSIGAVDVYVTAPNAPLTDADREFPGREYTTVSDYLTFPAGRYQLRVTSANNPAGGQVNSEPVSLGANKIYTFVIVGNGTVGAPPEVLAPIVDR